MQYTQFIHSTTTTLWLLCSLCHQLKSQSMQRCSWLDEFISCAPSCSGKWHYDWLVSNKNYPLTKMLIKRKFKIGQAKKMDKFYYIEDYWFLSACIQVFVDFSFFSLQWLSWFGYRYFIICITFVVFRTKIDNRRLIIEIFLCQNASFTFIFS